MMLFLYLKFLSHCNPTEYSPSPRQLITQIRRHAFHGERIGFWIVKDPFVQQLSIKRERYPTAIADKLGQGAMLISGVWKRKEVAV